MGLFVEESLTRHAVPRDHVVTTAKVTRSRSMPPVGRSGVGESSGNSSGTVVAAGIVVATVVEVEVVRLKPSGRILQRARPKLAVRCAYRRHSSSSCPETIPLPSCAATSRVARYVLSGEGYPSLTHAPSSTFESVVVSSL